MPGVKRGFESCRSRSYTSAAATVLAEANHGLPSDIRISLRCSMSGFESSLLTELADCCNRRLRRYPVRRDGRALALKRERFASRIGKGECDFAVRLLVDDDLPVLRVRR